MSEKTPFEQWWEDNADLAAEPKHLAWEAWIASKRHSRDELLAEIDDEGYVITTKVREAA